MIIGTMLMVRILKLSAINLDFPVQVYIYIYIYNNCNNIYDSSKNILKYIIVKYIATYVPLQMLECFQLIILDFIAQLC